jgi:hypothetical protein
MNGTVPFMLPGHVFSMPNPTFAHDSTFQICGDLTQFQWDDRQTPYPPTNPRPLDNRVIVSGVELDGCWPNSAARHSRSHARRHRGELTHFPSRGSRFPRRRRCGPGRRPHCCSPGSAAPWDQGWIGNGALVNRCLDGGYVGGLVARRVYVGHVRGWGPADKSKQS